jgi:hypothetical protein
VDAAVWVDFLDCFEDWAQREAGRWDSFAQHPLFFRGLRDVLRVACFQRSSCLEVADVDFMAYVLGLEGEDVDFMDKSCLVFG